MKEDGFEVKIINKVMEGRIVDAILNNSFYSCVTEGRQSKKDSYSIRRSALEHSVFSQQQFQEVLQ